MRLIRALRSLVAAPAGWPAPIALTPPVPVATIFKRFWPYARPYRRWLWLTLVFVAAGPLIDTVTLWLFKVLIDEVLVPRNFARFPPIAAAYLVLTLLSGLVSSSDRVLSAWVGERFLVSLRTSFFRHLHGLSLAFFEQRKLGDVLSRLTSDIASIEDLVLSGVADTLSYVLRLLFFTAILFYLRWDLALVALLITPMFWFTARRFSGAIKQAAREQRRRSGSISAVAEESLANMPLVQAYNRQEDEVQRFHEENLARFAAQMAAARLKGLFTPLIDLIDIGGTLVVAAFGTWELSRGQLTLGGLLVFLAYLSRLYSPVRGLSRLTNTIFSASAGAERILEFLDQQPAVVDRPGALKLDRARGALSVEHVTFCYPGNTTEALHDVSFELRAGETLALVGASGAGKSTIIKLLLRFYDPSAGRILLDGHDLRDVQMHALRENIAVLLQETLVFDATIRENIAYGRPGATEAEIVAAAAAADAHDFIQALPDGYDTVVGQRGRRLSGGQRQRIAIARALIRDAPILILDEPSTGLDAESSQRIMSLHRRLMQGRTTIVISHNLMMVREATVVLVLEAGRIIERGTHEQLLARGGAYARLHRQHTGDEAAPAYSGNPAAAG